MNNLDRIAATKRAIAMFEGAIWAWHNSTRNPKIDPELWDAMLRAYQTQLAELREELRHLEDAK